MRISTRGSVLKRLLLPAVFAVCISIASIIISSYDLAKRIEFITFNWRFQLKQSLGRTLKPSEEIIIVAIDEDSVDQLKLNPIIPTPRAYLAEIINFLSEAGAKLIVLDVILDRPISPDTDAILADAILADAIRKAGNVILPCVLTGENFDELKPILKDFARNALAIGIANVPSGIDNYVRRVTISWNNVDPGELRPKLMVDTENEAIFSLPVTVYAKYQGLDADTLGDIPADKSGSFFINYAGEAGTFETRLLGDFFFGSELSDITRFKDKIVLIGITHKDTRDRYLLTPLTSFYSSKNPYMPGVEILANALNTLINHSFIREINPLGKHLITFVLVVLTLVMLSRVHPVKGILVVISCIAFWWIFSFMLFSFANYSIAVIQPTTGFSLACIYAILRGFSREIRQAKALRDIFQRHVSPEVMQDIINQAESIAPAARKKATVLFLDLKDSVPWAEELKLEPEKLVRELNEYFTEMVDVIFQYGGTLLKFTGDGLIAVYGAPLAHPTPSLNAVLTGIEMQNRLDKLNTSRIAAGKRSLAIRIGINTGEAVFGNIGSEKRREYTTIGDTVNVAQRAEGQCEPGCVAITESTYQEVKEHIEVDPMGMRNLKGKSEPVMLYRVIRSCPGLENSEVNIKQDYELNGKDLESRVRDIFREMGFEVEKGCSSYDAIVKPFEGLEPKRPIVVEIKSSIHPSPSRDDLRQLDDWVFDLSGEEKARKEGLGGMPTMTTIATIGWCVDTFYHPTPYKGVMVFNGPTDQPFQYRSKNWLNPNEEKFAQKRDFCIISLGCLISWYEQWQKDNSVAQDLWEKIQSTCGVLA